MFNRSRALLGAFVLSAAGSLGAMLGALNPFREPMQKPATASGSSRRNGTTVAHAKRVAAKRRNQLRYKSSLKG